MNKQTWDQLKNITAVELMRALKRDKWTLDVCTGGGSMNIFKKSSRRVSIHFHPGKTYGAKMLKGLLADIGWENVDYKRLKLIK